jgi:fermentation-respiration switch protein FrsA (DUF1100 family)
VAFSQTDFTQDLKRIAVPTLVMHGDDNQIVPYADSGPLTAELLKNATLKTYKGFPHGMPTSEAATINAGLLTFIRSSAISRSLSPAGSRKRRRAFVSKFPVVAAATAGRLLGYRAAENPHCLLILPAISSATRSARTALIVPIRDAIIPNLKIMAS